ncbi:MAG: pyridoxal kinase [Hyphomicrobium sp.]|nr:pyridoxal kinase [Hyphomicrobium sp.]
MARVLALSSHVAFGSVGLAAMVPALHWLGHEVIVMPTVVLSNHPGYARFAGEPIPASQIAGMLDALEANGWFNDTAAVISGYLPSPGHVAAVRSAVERVRRGNAGALYVCDPVFGDEPEGIYLSEATASAIRDELLPIATLATPNRFELSWLAGLPVGDPIEARQAAWALGVPSVLATSVPADDNRLANVLVMGNECAACYVRRRASAPHGTGDLLAAMYLGNLLNGASPAYSLGASASAVDATVAASMSQDELPLAAMNALWASARVLPTTQV